jgi:hypothetical protein
MAYGSGDDGGSERRSGIQDGWGKKTSRNAGRLLGGSGDDDGGNADDGRWMGAAGTTAGGKGGTGPMAGGKRRAGT